jgi:hypothetical protein
MEVAKNLYKVVKTNLFDIDFVLKSLVSVTLLSYAFGALFNSYTGQIYSQTISFFVEDYWCDPKTQGVGVHCFGDFAAPSAIMNEKNPWDHVINIAYTPINFLFFKLLNAEVIRSIDLHLPLLLNLILTVVALVTPGLHMIMSTNSARIKSRGKLLLLLSLCSAPSLIIIDRGASMFLLFPLVYFFYLSIQKVERRKAMLILFIMTLWKPQMMFLAILIYTSFGFLSFVKICAASVTGLVLSFVVYPHGLVQNLISWLENIREYQNYQSMPALGNYSLVNFFSYLQAGWKFLIGNQSFIDAFTANLDSNRVSFISTMLIFVSGILVIINKQTVTLLELIIAINLFLIVTPGVTFGYYLSLLLIPLFLHAQDSSHLLQKNNLFSKVWIGFYLFFLIALPAWPVSWGYLGLFRNYAWQYYGVQWTFAHLTLSLLCLMLFVHFFNSWRKEKYPNKIAALN